MAEFPILYKKTSTGAIQTWRIWTEGARYFTEHGQLGGQLQRTPGALSEPKNVGRSNATTAEQQATADALSKWEKKSKSGYTLTAGEARAGEVNEEFVEGGIFPMLAQSYSKHGAKIVFPCAVQAKLDGHRCIAVVNGDGTVGLWSRTRKPITGVPHIARAIEGLNLRPGTMLDGELYNHEYRDNFEELTHFIRQQTPAPGHEVVHYHVYDLAGSGPFTDRLLALGRLACGAPPLVLVDTKTVQDEAELMEAFAEYTANGYEGAIARNLRGLYVNKRSYDLQKVKEFEDAEFTVLSVENGIGKMENCAIFVCASPAGEFRAKMMGSLDSLAVYLKDPSLAVGKQLTVKFHGLTNSGLPRFPIGVRFRQDA